MRGEKAAIAVFVKTPGRSPIKTRLAKRLGRKRAEEFYCLSLRGVEASVAAAAERFSISSYWAVAERAALVDPRWQRFARVCQGTGGLGERLSRVIGELQARHGIVLAIGGDAPQITPDLIGQALAYLRHERENVAHVLGRCHDGGFYLVGTRSSLPPDTWLNVPYSTTHAADRLAARLARHGKIAELDRLTDVDEAEDLDILSSELRALVDPLPEQLAVLNWIRGTQGAIE